VLHRLSTAKQIALSAKFVCGFRVTLTRKSSILTMGSVDEDQSLVDPASAPIETPVDLSTKRKPLWINPQLAGQLPASRRFLFARRCPPPWSVEELDACFVVRDHSGAADRGEYREVAGAFGGTARIGTQAEILTGFFC
jgi:hypothetical protein